MITFKDEKGYKKISKALQMTIIKKCKILESLETKPRSGRPRKVSAKTAIKIVRDTKKNPQVTSGEIQAALEKVGVVVSKRTIRQYLNSYELLGQVGRKKPLLRQCHKKALLQYARQHLDTTYSFRNTVICRDETKTELYGHNHKRYVWREDTKTYSEQNTIPTVKHGGGSLMFLGCVNFKGRILCKLMVR
uniref:Transposase Tc1-like domain-containing protein n=1 Tax=Esox lucius TaxID=8010 RepID=A0AAY5L983_ESOLU